MDVTIPVLHYAVMYFDIIGSEIFRDKLTIV
jgi:hypothetical protein